MDPYNQMRIQRVLLRREYAAILRGECMDLDPESFIGQARLLAIEAEVDELTERINAKSRDLMLTIAANMSKCLENIQFIDHSVAAQMEFFDD
jgi:hypothetical protein